MSMREFLDGDCGQVNPVLKVASHFTQDVSFREKLAHGSPIGSENLHPSMLAPTTYRMESLLEELHSIENQNIPNQGAIASTSRDWALDFAKQNSSTNQAGEGWAQEYYSDNFNQAWNEAPSFYPHDVAIVPGAMYSNNHNLQSFQSPKDLLDESKWVGEYASPSFESREKTDVMITADKILESVKDPKIKATDFMSYVEKLSSGEVKLNEASQRDEATGLDVQADAWASEFEFNYTEGAKQNWANEFSRQEGVFESPLDQPTQGSKEQEEFWHKLEEEWNRLSKEESSQHPWLSNPISQLNEPYKFATENPFMDNSNPLEEGKRRLFAGDIPSAVLLFESAIQKEPENPECWLFLGSTQAQNEQDPLAISALHKCIELDGGNLQALMALAASLTNESYHLQACSTLKNWLKNNPKYGNIVPSESSEFLINKTSSILPTDELVNVQRLFMEAARRNPSGGIDPDIQCALGILFNLSSDYQKAADCFESALSATPDDSLLWNRLGATLANGGRSADAIGAYRKALEISPGFIRTRYNLGISCVNLGAYREAAEHFMSSLNFQAAGKANKTDSMPGKNVMSDAIWTSLRMILHLLDKSNLSHAIDSRNLDLLNQELGIQG